MENLVILAGPTTIYTTPAWLILVFFGGLFLTICAFLFEHDLIGSIFALSLVIWSLIIIPSPLFDEIDHYETKVMITEETNMKEFLNRYEIINQEGEILTVKERE